MKNCKSRESFCLSMLTIYTNVWSTFWHVYWCHVYFAFCKIPTCGQAKNKLTHLDWDFMVVGLQTYRDGWRWWMQAHLVPSDQKSFCKWNHFSRLSHQTGSFYLGSLLHIISSLLSHFCLFQNAILHKMLKLGFWNFRPIFLRMQFAVVATFFSGFDYQFELIFASYN